MGPKATDWTMGEWFLHLTLIVALMSFLPFWASLGLGMAMTGLELNF